tara:strand:+ start:6023 stop:6328 length:306 start_codon:yes stop_codon:yes gene_type:complete
MSTYRFECSKCDIEILTQGHELTECLYCRVTTDNTQTLYNALAKLKDSQDEVSKLEKIIDDFDGSVRHLMTATPQLETILKNNLIRVKSKYHQDRKLKGEE